MSTADLVVDALAAHRLTRLWQDDEVWPAKEAREAFKRWAGDSRWADLASCPWCASVWIAAAVLVLRHRFPRAWPLAARVLASSAVAGHLAEL